MRKPLFLALVLFFTNAPFFSLSAQEKIIVLPATSLRVWLADSVRNPLSGALVSLSADTLVIEVEKQAVPLVLPIHSVAKLEVRQSKRRIGIGSGALLGLLLGTAAGVVIGANGDVSDGCIDFCNNELDTFVLGIVGGGVGLMSGSLLGAALKMQYWQEVPIAQLDVQPVKTSKPQKQMQSSGKNAKSIYFELFGSGLFYSFNYDRMFTNNVGGRFGVMYIPSGSDNESYFLLPVMANYLAGSSAHKLEMGAGVVIILDAGEIGDIWSEGSGVAGTLFYGYRYQPMGKGFLFRIGLNPMFANSRFLFWAGLSLGVTF